jgi:hypothetical protein
MGKRGPQPQKAKAPPPPPPKAQGKGGVKRTPTSAFDPAAGKDIYEPEKVVAKRTIRGGTSQWQVKWQVKWMHGDLQKSAKDSTLEHSLFAAFNTD